MVQWTLTDHLNTVRDIAKYDPGTDTTTVVNHLVYDAFGNITTGGRVTSVVAPKPPAPEPPIPEPPALAGGRRMRRFLYTTGPFDQDSQLQNNLNRWYDAAVGRWLSEDPIGFLGGDENLYRYVGNGVLTAVDAEGLACYITYECTLEESWEHPDSGELYCKYKCTDVARTPIYGLSYDPYDPHLCDSPPLNGIPEGGITGTHWSRASKSWWPWSKPRCKDHIRVSEPYDFCPDRDLPLPIVDFKECMKACGHADRAKNLCALFKELALQKACETAMTAGSASCEAYCIKMQKPIGAASNP